MTCFLFLLSLLLLIVSLATDEEIAGVVAKVGTSGEFLAGQVLEGNSLTKWHADLLKDVEVRQRSNSAHPSYSESERPVPG